MTEPAGGATPISLVPDGASRGSRLRASIRVTLGLVATGVVIGGLWAWIAPPIHAVVAITRSGERVHDYLGTESQHFFVAPCLLLGLFTVVAVVAPVLLWQWREQRGPGMVIVLWIGLVIAVLVAAGVGALVVRLRYGDVNFDAVPLGGDHKVAYIIQAPPVFFARRLLPVIATLMWPAGTAALVYAVLAAANARDDLGGVPVPVKPPTAAPVAPMGPEAPEVPVS